MAGELPVRKDMDKSVRKKIEAVLFASDKALSLAEIARISGVKAKIAKRTIASLNREYEKHCFEIAVTDRGYVLQLREEFYPVVKDLVEPEMGEKLLQTLALIASNEPIKQSALRDFVGERVYEDVKELCKRGLVRYKKEGSTKILRTTPEFKKRFKFSGQSTTIVK
ncbi:MAG: SMC-Scp complex subunit ScpB [Candidatus Thermoplasmatota archaeon]|nr:SMC-Scp complex subunit ScpB [Candidatus Thermoplasmatota archaeon]